MRSFLYLYALFLIISILLLVCLSKEEVFLWINSSHTVFSDFVFQATTYLGDGIFAAIMVVLLALYKIRLGLVGMFSFVGTGLLVQFLKKIIFPDQFRPLRYFEGIQDIYVIPGLDTHSFFSFPSGHTATSFGVFFLLTLVVSDYTKIKGKSLLGVVFCFIAIAVGYSRIYLAQHFLIDVLVGSAIGIIVTWMVYHFVATSKYFIKPWMEKSFFTNN